MYQGENNGRGCKVRNNTPKNDWNETNSTIQHRGANYAQCSSNDIHCVLNAAALAKWLTTSHPSSKVAIRWNGTTYKRCVIDVTI
jgi:hypothetical protein